VVENFYLLWPWLVLWCHERRLPGVLLVMIAAGVAFRLLLLPIVGPDRVFWFSLCRLDALALGALLTVVIRRPELAESAHQCCRWTLLTLGPALLVLYPLTSGRGLFVMQTVKYLLIAVAFTALLGATIGPGRWPWLDQFFSAGFLRWCGKYSYAMYVFHPIIYLQATAFLRANLSPASTRTNLYLVCEFPILIGVVLFVSWASWRLFEKHFLKLKKFFKYSLEYD
jgi:peptidoglycan/LPS O-acetylase OafA/YrhL